MLFLRVFDVLGVTKGFAFLKGVLAMLLSKELVEEVKETSERLAALGLNSEDLDKERIDLLIRMVDYMKSLVWLSRSSSRKKWVDFLSSGYSYRNTAEIHGVTIKSLYDSIGYADKLLKKRIGNAFVLLQSGDISGAEREFAIGTGSCPSAIFVREVEDRFKPVFNAGVDLSNCEKELRFLSRFTRRHFTMVMDSLDRQKLEHLLYILLENDRCYMTERGYFFRCLEGELEPAEALVHLHDNYVYAAPKLSVD